MAAAPSLSIIIPMYNAGKYIERCLQSIVTQSVSTPPKTDSAVEVIVVDDGSADSSADVVRGMADEYPAIRLIRQSNQGVSAARNAGVRLSAGKYIFFMDADDFLFSGVLQPLLRIIATGEYDVLRCDYSRVKAEATPSLFEGEMKVEKCLSGWEYLETRPRVYALWTMFFRRDLLADFEQNSNIQLHEDGVFLQKVLPTVRKMAIIPVKVYAYVIVEGSATSRKRPQEQLFNCGLNIGLEFTHLLNQYEAEYQHYNEARASVLARRGYFVFMLCLWPLINRKVSMSVRRKCMRTLRGNGLLPLGDIIEDQYCISWSRPLCLLWKLSRYPRLWLAVSPLLSLLCRRVFRC